jgi:hypothetical protein
LKLFQEWEEGGMMEIGGGGEFKYDIIDIFKELL